MPDARGAREAVVVALGGRGILGHPRLLPARAGLRLGREDRRKRIVVDTLGRDAERVERVPVDLLGGVERDTELADVRPDDPRRVDAKGMPFQSCYIYVEGKQTIREGGYRSWPSTLSCGVRSTLSAADADTASFTAPHWRE